MKNLIFLIAFSFSSLFAIDCNSMSSVKSFNGHYYAKTSNRTSYDAIRVSAINDNGYLAIPNSAEENEFIKSLVGGNTEAWIGVFDPNYARNYCYDNATCFFDDTRFRDVKGQVPIYKNWATNEPNNFVDYSDIENSIAVVEPLGENWVILNGNTGQWYDVGNHKISNQNPRKHVAVVEFDEKPICFNESDGTTETNFPERVCNTQVFDDNIANADKGTTTKCLFDINGKEYCPQGLADAASYWSYIQGDSFKNITSVTDYAQGEYKEYSSSVRDFMDGFATTNTNSVIDYTNGTSTGNTSTVVDRTNGTATTHTGTVLDKTNGSVKVNTNVTTDYQNGSSTIASNNVIDYTSKIVSGIVPAEQIKKLFTMTDTTRNPSSVDVNKISTPIGTIELDMAAVPLVWHFYLNGTEIASGDYSTSTKIITVTYQNINFYLKVDCNSASSGGVSYKRANILSTSYYSYYSCSSGELVGTTCQSKACPSGYFDNGTNCEKVVRFNYYSYQCPNTYTPINNGFTSFTKSDPDTTNINDNTLDDDVNSSIPPVGNCKKTVSFNYYTYQCPVGFNATSTGLTTCTKSDTDNTVNNESTLSLDCNSSTPPEGNCGKNVTYQYYTYECPSGYTASSNGLTNCPRTDLNSNQDNTSTLSQACNDSISPVGNCSKSISYNYYAYNCPVGYTATSTGLTSCPRTDSNNTTNNISTLSTSCNSATPPEGNCTKNVFYNYYSYECSNGYTAINSGLSSCNRTDTSNTSNTSASLSQSCNSAIPPAANCYKDISYKYYTYSCPAGYSIGNYGLTSCPKIDPNNAINNQTTLDDNCNNPTPPVGNCSKSIDYAYYQYVCSGATNSFNQPYTVVNSGLTSCPRTDTDRVNTNTELANSCNSATPPTNNCRTTEYTCNSQVREPVWIDNKWQCSPYPCYGNNNVEDLSQNVGTLDREDNGWTEDGRCSGTIYIFNGAAKQCRSSDRFFGLTGGGCCKDDKTAMGLLSCNAEEKELRIKKESKKCHYIGEYCSKKLNIGLAKICVRTSKSYCCFNSTLGRIIAEQGRAQLTDIDWGRASNPNCRGFTVEEFQRLDLSQMDLTEFTNTIELPDVTNKQTAIIEKINSHLNLIQ